MSNAAIGAGVLAFPYAFSLTGVMLGPALAVFFAAIMWYEEAPHAVVVCARALFCFAGSVLVLIACSFFFWGGGLVWAGGRCTF